MIFSRFFTPDHAHSDPKIRKSAIDKLSPDDAKQKSILHELAFNDESVDVMLAALSRLDSFPLWQKVAQTSKNARIKKAASSIVKEAVLTGDGLPYDQKQQYLLESADSELVVEALLAGGELLKDTETVLKLLDKTNRSSVKDKLVVDSDNGELISALILREKDQSTLQRWVKKLDGSKYVEPLNVRLVDLEEERAKPLRISKSVTMTLSKLLALTDATDYEKALENKQILENEYKEFALSFDCLSERDREAFIDKKQTIDDRVNAALARLEEDFKAQQGVMLRQTCVQQLEESLITTKASVTSLFSNLATATLEQFEHTQNQIQSLQSKLDDNVSLIGRDISETLQTQITALSVQTSALPEWQRHAGLLDTFFKKCRDALDAAQDDSREMKQIFGELEEEFNTLFDSGSPLTSIHTKQWRALKKQVSKAQRELREKVQGVVNERRKSLNIIDSLIEKGKFRAAIRRFEGFLADWDSTEDAVKDGLLKKYDTVASKINDLAEWQTYLAAPRKPSLLEEAQGLNENSELSMPQRAERIKQLRNQWRSLSMANSVSEEEQTLNTAFDQALEQAFEPCRVYFAEQEQIRKENTRIRESILDALKDMLDNSVVADDQLQTSFDSVVKQWRNGPSIPKATYATLKESFDGLRKQVIDKLTPFWRNNEQQKQALITQSKKLSESDHNSDTLEQAKQIQQRWKAIGTAGQKLDGKLWREFRQFQDALFERGKRVALEHKAQTSKDIDELNIKLNALISDLALLEQKDLDERVQQLESDFAFVPSSVSKSMRKRLDKALHNKKASVEIAQIEAKQREVQALKRVLLGLAEDSSIDLTSLASSAELPKQWLTELEFNASKSEGEINEVLLKAEILLDIPSPDVESQNRKNMQMLMLANNFGSNTHTKPQEIIVDLLQAVQPEQLNEEVVSRIIDCVQSTHIGK